MIGWSKKVFLQFCDAITSLLTLNNPVGWGVRTNGKDEMRYSNGTEPGGNRG